MVSTNPAITNAKQPLTRPLLTEREVAVMTGMSVSSVRRWRLLGKGPRYVKVGGVAVRYNTSDIDAWLTSQPSGGEQCVEVS
jgi:predicted DNA-binding transcriptional regulator AlpA